MLQDHYRKKNSNEKYGKMLAWFNRLLLVVIWGVGIVLIFEPYVYGIQAQAQVRKVKNDVHGDLVTRLARLPEQTMYIPSIGVRQDIVEAQTIKEAKEDVWRRPNTGTLEGGGNIVMVSHRYANIGGERASTFYSLPDLEAGDLVYVRGEGDNWYIFEMRSSETVEPTRIDIEDPTEETKLTLYTCTPLWNATHRYVVHAYPVEDPELVEDIRAMSRELSATSGPEAADEVSPI